MNLTPVARELVSEFAVVGIGHTAELTADGLGITITSAYSDPLVVVEAEGRYRLLAQNQRGESTTIETELSTDSPTELLALYLSFHTLWSIHRLVGRVGSLQAVREHPSLPAHKSLLVAHIGVSTSSTNTEIADYAQALIENARSMLRLH